MNGIENPSVSLLKIKECTMFQILILALWQLASNNVPIGTPRIIKLLFWL